MSFFKIKLIYLWFWNFLLFKVEFQYLLPLSISALTFSTQMTSKESPTLLPSQTTSTQTGKISEWRSNFLWYLKFISATSMTISSTLTTPAGWCLCLLGYWLHPSLVIASYNPTPQNPFTLNLFQPYKTWGACYFTIHTFSKFLY